MIFYVNSKAECSVIQPVPRIRVGAVGFAIGEIEIDGTPSIPVIFWLSDTFLQHQRRPMKEISHG